MHAAGVAGGQALWKLIGREIAEYGHDTLGGKLHDIGAVPEAAKPDPAVAIKNAEDL